jgi:regulator of sigma D
MVAPTFSIFSELYFKFLKNSMICNTLLNYDIKGHFRYVDDILIVYDEEKTNIDTFLDCFNNISPKLKFTIEKEID